MTGEPSEAFQRTTSEESSLVDPQVEPDSDAVTSGNPLGPQDETGLPTTIPIPHQGQPVSRLGPIITSPHGQYAWDIPPIIASPYLSEEGCCWKPRKIKQCTPQRLSSIILLSDPPTGDEPPPKLEEVDEEITIAEKESSTAEGVESSTVQDQNSDDHSNLDQQGNSVASTSSFSCPPLVWANKALVVAIFEGEIRLYNHLLPNNLHAPTTLSQPAAILDLPSDASIAQLTVFNESTFLALTVEGHVYLCSVHEESLKLEHTWNTGSCGATCMTLFQSKAEKLKNLCIGYTWGQIECWKLSEKPPFRRRPKCLWRCLVDEFFGVKSLAVLEDPPRQSPQASKVDDTKDQAGTPFTTSDTSSHEQTGRDPKEMEENHPSSLLMVIRQSLTRDQSPSILALDLDAIMKVESKEAATTTLASFSPFRVLPDPAMNIIENEGPSTILAHDDKTLPTKMNSMLVSSRGTNQCLPFHQNCGIALANGTVALLSRGWGVQNHSTDQLLLTYPAIGMGNVDIGGVHYFVCCLRAGTCYFIPTDRTTSEVLVVQYPHDLDADMMHVYIQEFAAANLDHEDGSSIPVLLFCLPGGVIDIYACTLMTTTKPVVPEEEQVLQELIRQGSLSLALQILEEGDFDEGEDHETELLWKKAAEEVQTSTTKKPSSYSDLQSMPGLQKLLLHLASM